MNSAIYTGTVMHRRFAPVEHRFSYGVYYLWLDLAELGTLDRDDAGVRLQPRRPVLVPRS